MNPQAAQKYLKTKVMTATAEQLQMMLFDGAVRSCEQARIALEKKDYERSFQSLSKAQAIVNQLICALKSDIAPDLCKKLKGLYTFAYRRLVDANLHHRIESLDEALKRAEISARDVGHADGAAWQAQSRGRGIGDRHPGPRRPHGSQH